jgi:integrase
VLSSRTDGAVYVDTLRTKRARTVSVVAALVSLVARWDDGKAQEAWLFSAPGGGPLNEGNWRRSVRWTEALEAVKRPRLRVHDLGHTAASLWLAAGADPKVVQRILGHASAAMTMDLYGHLIDRNLWEAAARVGEVPAESGAFGGTSGARTTAQAAVDNHPEPETLF